MVEPVNTPRTDINVDVKGGYQTGRWNTNGVMWNYSCVNCGDQFSNRTSLRFHYNKCTNYGDVQHVTENSDIQNELKCSRCGEIFLEERRLKFHYERCEFYAAMQRTEREDYSGFRHEVSRDKDIGRNIVQTDDDVITIDDEDETKNRETDINVVKSENNEKHEKRNVVVPKKNVVNAVLSGNKGIENKTEDTKITNSATISKHWRESARFKLKHIKEQTIYDMKRKYDVISSDALNKSQMTPKKVRIEGNGLPLLKSLTDDMEQEARHNLFDRVQAHQRSYKCPRCGARFKYKQKFDIHVKYAHVQSGSLIDAAKPDSANTMSVEDANNFGLTESSISTDGNSNCFKKETITSVKRTGSNYPCDFCHFSFRYYSRCERHMKSVHKEQKEQTKFGIIFSCTKCHVKFSDRYALLKHYNRIHLRNGNKSNADEKVISEQFDNICNVDNIMRHLRNNLTCLQDRNGFETDQPGKRNEPRLKMTDDFRDRNISTGTVDQSKHTSDMREMKLEITTPERTSFKDTLQKNNISPANYDLSENDKPLDLSTKPQSQKERETPCDSQGKMTFIDKKLSGIERTLLKEYYKDFLQEYSYI